jgi:Na+/H+ antiporter NhaA
VYESGVDPVVSGLLIGLLTNAYEPRPAGPARVSPNDRIQHRLHPWTSRIVVPVFALANAGLHIDGQLLATAAASPVTWGIVLAYLLGKPLGIALAGRAAGMRRDELAGAALAAGAGFTAALLIATRAFDGALLDQAKLGILVTALLAPALSVAALRARRPVLATPCVAQ